MHRDRARLPSGLVRVPGSEGVRGRVHRDGDGHGELRRVREGVPSRSRVRDGRVRLPGRRDSVYDGVRGHDDGPGELRDLWEGVHRACHDLSRQRLCLSGRTHGVLRSVHGSDYGREQLRHMRA
jgi:hypothetical protein